MGIGVRVGRLGKAALLLAVGAAGAGAAIAVADVPDSGVIHACYATSPASGLPVSTGPNLRIIDASAGQVCNPVGGPSNEATVNWTVTGATGPQGPAGQNGQPGTPGQNGATGKTATITAGNTFTIGNDVITVGGGNGITIASPTIKTTAPAVAVLTLGTGRTELVTDILGLSFAPGARATGSGGGAGKVRFQDISITKVFDNSSAALAQACASGKHFPKATVVFRKAGGEQLVYRLTDVLVSSYQVSSGGGDHARPEESLTLNFTALKIQYTKQTT